MFFMYSVSEIHGETKNKQIYTKTIFRKFTTILFILKNGVYCIYTYKGRNVDLYMIVIYLGTTVIHCQEKEAWAL